MTKFFLIVLLSLVLTSSCSKNSGTPDPNFSKNVQDKLAAYVWQPAFSETKEENVLVNYKPNDCEMDNSYRFLFQEKSNQFDLDKGTKICEVGIGSFEDIFSKAKNSSSFILNKETGTIKFEDQDQYSSYLAEVKGDELVLTYQNNNPVANVIPMKYYFKGLKK